MIDSMMMQLEIFLKMAFKKHGNVRFVTGNRRLTMFAMEGKNYVTVTWKLDTYTDSLSRPTNWPKDL